MDCKELKLEEFQKKIHTLLRVLICADFLCFISLVYRNVTLVQKSQEKNWGSFRCGPTEYIKFPLLSPIFHF